MGFKGTVGSSVSAISVCSRAEAAAVDAIAKANAVEMRTVQIDGQTRVVGAASLGGRRLPTRDEIASINARLETFQPQTAVPRVASPPPAGVTAMEVEEVGRPAA